MDTLTIILIALTATLLIANIVMFTTERKLKTAAPNRKSKAYDEFCIYGGLTFWTKHYQFI